MYCAKEEVVVDRRGCRHVVVTVVTRNGESRVKNNFFAKYVRVQLVTSNPKM
jgi:hypothetical protein